MKYLKVEGHPSFLRDPNTNSIINNNMSEYQEYLLRRETKNDENQKIQNLETDVANMKGDLDEIKFLLRSLIGGSK